MKKILTLLSFLVLFTSIYAQKVEYEYEFEIPKTEKRGEYQLINLPNSRQLGEVGNPAVPFVSVKLLLPPNKKAGNIKYVFEDKVKLAGKYNLYPMQQVRPTNENATANNNFSKNEELYKSNIKYPTRKKLPVSTAFMNGYGFAISNFTPIEYNPKTGEVFIYKKVKVIVNCKKNKQKFSPSGRKNIIEKVKNFADNPEQISNYTTVRNSQNYDILMITDDNFLEEFDDLVTFHLQRGLQTKIVSIQFISQIMDGKDVQEKMRNYIIKEYQNNDIQYVTLAGDADVVPYRGMTGSVLTGGEYMSDNNIPADVYFSGLDGNWDNNDNGIWGEIDEVDILPEVAVGRLPFSNISELNNIKNKIISYTNNPVVSNNELNTPLLAGEKLHDDPLTFGSDYLNLLVGHQESNGFTTDGINTECTTRYASDSSWDGTGVEIIPEINAGHSFIHHVGHANANFVMGLYNSDITTNVFSQLDGEKHNYTLFYSNGCICGAFDSDDCVSEKMVTLKTFAVGVFTNSRFGWFNEGQTEGPSAHIHREFVDALYHDHELHAGEAERISKYETAPWLNLPDEHEPGAQRWVFYCHNVLTDPALPIWTRKPIEFDITVAAEVEINQNLTISVKENNNPLVGYNCVLLQNGNLIAKTITDENGDATLFIDPSYANIGQAQLFVSGNNVITKQKPININKSNTGVVTITEYSFEDNNNNTPEYNENIKLKLKIENLGEQEAQNIKISVSSDDPNVVINSADFQLDNIAASDAVFFEEIEIETKQTPDQYVVDLELEITSNTSTATKIIPVKINAPMIELLDMTITEMTGNSNDAIEPGETGKAVVRFFNIGHSTTPEILAEAISNNTNIDIISDVQNLGTLSTDDTLTAIVEFSLANNLEDGDSVVFDLNLDAQKYSKSILVKFFIGVANEDFETGDFSRFAWDFNEHPWHIQDSVVFAGNFALISDTINSNEESVLKISISTTQDGQVSFYKKVSSEPTYDKLIFIIDEEEKDEWSGTKDWSKSEYALTKGTHTLVWKYAKDVGLSSGFDCAFVDNISFPAFGEITFGEKTIHQSDNHKVAVFPTVFDNEVNFVFESELVENYKIQIFDITGNLIYSENGFTDNGKNYLKWNSNCEVKTGIYLYKIYIGNEYFTGRIVKQ